MDHIMDNRSNSYSPDSEASSPSPSPSYIVSTEEANQVLQNTADALCIALDATLTILHPRAPSIEVTCNRRQTVHPRRRGARSTQSSRCNQRTYTSRQPSHTHQPAPHPYAHRWPTKTRQRQIRTQQRFPLHLASTMAPTSLS